MEEGLFNRWGSRRVHCSEGSDSDDEYEDDYTGDCSSEENLVNDDDNLWLLYVEQRLRELMAQKLNEYWWPCSHFFFSSPPFCFSLSLSFQERERITSCNKNICGQRYVNMAVQEDAKIQMVGLYEPIIFKMTIRTKWLQWCKNFSEKVKKTRVISKF